tara:strand:+ start:4673 stop:5122 length:450 start_codon:yes stop_codon:yes gene_type:complete
MFKPKELFEIPIYRVSEETYYEKLRGYIVENTTEYSSESYLRKQFGGDWLYNEIIGYIKFYKYDRRQIRCEYWETDALKKVKTRKKQFIRKSDNFSSIPFNADATNIELIERLNMCIIDAISQLPINRVANRELLDITFEFIDWRKVLA